MADERKYYRLDENGLDHLVGLVKRDTQKKLNEGSNIGIEEDTIGVTGFATNLDIDSLFRN